jgi:hypothetical protein
MRDNMHTQVKGQQQEDDQQEDQQQQHEEQENEQQAGPPGTLQLGASAGQAAQAKDGCCDSSY